MCACVGLPSADASPGVRVLFLQIAKMNAIRAQADKIAKGETDDHGHGHGGH